MAIALAVLLACLAVVSVVRYPFLHPLQLWCVPWAASAGLFALHLLPYRPISVTTALLIAGATAAYAVGALCAANATWPRRVRDRTPLVRRAGAPWEPIEVAAALAFGLTFLGLAVYLVELTQTFGLRDTVVTAPEVRTALGQGTASLTIKYLYVAYAAAALCGIAAGGADRRRRRLWLGLGALTVLSQYFTTGRANIVLAALVLALAEAVVRRREPTMRGLLAATGVVAVFALLVFSAGGAIIGKTLENNELDTIASPLTETRALRPLALPYHYASAPIAALDRQVDAARRTSDAGGCATFAVVCTLAARAGADVTPEPAVRPFTGPPLPWNTYTALDLPVLDGGPVFVLVFFLLVGAWLGWLWRSAREGSRVAVGLYAVYGPVVLYSAVQNSFFAPHIVGAALLVAMFLWLGAPGQRFARLRPRRSR